MDQKNLNHHNDNDDDDDDGYDLSCNNDSFVTFNTTNLDELNRIIEESSSLDLPKSLIITNMDSRIFQQSTEQRDEFERAFRSLDSDVKFLYFKSFRRARLDFSDQKAATKARIIMNQIKFGDEQINCYFAEIMNKKNSSNDNDHNYLKPPALEKQFLISPPSSPPEGWEPCEEAQPILNIDLQSALANLIPGQAHELHPPTCNQPGIVVHVCGSTATTTTKQDSLSIDPDNDNDDNDNDDDDNADDGFFNDDSNIPMMKMKIVQTSCPPRYRSDQQN